MNMKPLTKISEMLLMSDDTVNIYRYVLLYYYNTSNIVVNNNILINYLIFCD